MLLLRVLAVVLSTLAALAAFGWLLNPSLSRAIGFLGFAFGAFVAGTIVPDYWQSRT